MSTAMVNLSSTLPAKMTQHNSSLVGSVSKSSSLGGIMLNNTTLGGIMPAIKNPKRKRVKRLQKARGPLPFGGSLLPPPKPAPLRNPIVHALSALEEKRWSNFNLLSPIDNNFAVTVGLYRAQVKGETAVPTEFNHYHEIIEVQDWLVIEPDLFVSDNKDAHDALRWGQDFRLCLAHEWIERLLDYRHLHLSAVALLASDQIMNDAVTEKLACDLMKILKITPVKTFPVVPPTPK